MLLNVKLLLFICLWSYIIKVHLHPLYSKYWLADWLGTCEILLTHFVKFILSLRINTLGPIMIYKKSLIIVFSMLLKQEVLFCCFWYLKYASVWIPIVALVMTVLKFQKFCCDNIPATKVRPLYNESPMIQPQ